MLDATCSVAGCGKDRHSHAGHGLCAMHYARLARTGSVGPAAPIITRNADNLQGIWSKADQRNGPEGCWPWLAYIDENGYGRASFRGAHWRAHRLTYTLSVGPIPDGCEIDHLCRNTACVNPRHLEAVTPRVNQDRRNEFLRASRPDTCRRGHPLSGDNLKLKPSRPTWRVCRTCDDLAAAARSERRRAASQSRNKAA